MSVSKQLSYNERITIYVFSSDKESETSVSKRLLSQSDSFSIRTNKSLRLLISKLRPESKYQNQWMRDVSHKQLADHHHKEFSILLKKHNINANNPWLDNYICLTCI